jgi:hypothetical protein
MRTAVRLFLIAAVLVIGGAVTIVIGMIGDPLLLPPPDGGHLLPAERMRLEARHARSLRLQIGGGVAAGAGILGILAAGAAAALAPRRPRAEGSHVH